MTMKRKGIAVAAAIAALGVGGAAIAVATGAGEDDDDATQEAITGRALDRASEAALEHVGGGEVTETEVGDEEGYYEVEVTRDDGSQVDVHLNRDFEVTSDQADDDDSGEDDD